MNKNQSITMYAILGMLVLAFILMLFSGPTSSTEELSYTAFMQKVANKEIKSVEISNDSLIAIDWESIMPGITEKVNLR